MMLLENLWYFYTFLNKSCAVERNWNLLKDNKCDIFVKSFITTKIESNMNESRVKFMISMWIEFLESATVEITCMVNDYKFWI